MGRPAQTPPPRVRPVAAAFGGLSFLAGDPDRPLNAGLPDDPDHEAGLYGAMPLWPFGDENSPAKANISTSAPTSRSSVPRRASVAYHFNAIRERMGPAMKNACRTAIRQGRPLDCHRVH